VGAARRAYLLEGRQRLLDLAEVPEEELQGAADQGRVVVHDELEQDAQEGLAARAVQVQVPQVLLVAEDLLGLGHQAPEDALVAGLLQVARLVGLLEVGEQVGEPVVQAHVEDELQQIKRALVGGQGAGQTSLFMQGPGQFPNTQM